jgi:hypothetical protein
MLFSNFEFSLHSHGIHGYPCGGSTCSQCAFGIHGWRCQAPATSTVCIVSFNSAPAPFPSNWQAFARYEVTQQNNVAWAKFYFSSTLQVKEVVLRTGTQSVAWQVYPQNAAQVGVTINWARLPAGTMYSYPDATASTNGFSTNAGRIAPAYIIPVGTTPIYLWVATNDTLSTLSPAPSAAANQLQCTTTTNFQPDAINALATGTNFKRSTGTEEWQESTRHLYALQG